MYTMRGLVPSRSALWCRRVRAATAATTPTTRRQATYSFPPAAPAVRTPQSIRQTPGGHLRKQGAVTATTNVSQPRCCLGRTWQCEHATAERALSLPHEHLARVVRAGHEHSNTNARHLQPKYTVSAEVVVVVACGADRANLLQFGNLSPQTAVLISPNPPLGITHDNRTYLSTSFSSVGLADASG